MKDQTNAKRGTKRVRLPIFGAETNIEVPVPGGVGSLTALLPPLRRVSSAMMEVSASVRKKRGQSVTCRAGCDACCRHLVPVSVVEAKALATAVERMPAAKKKATLQRFGAAIQRLEAEKLIGPKGPEPRTALLAEDAEAASYAAISSRYFEARIDCPFLESSRCTIYEERPFVCREYQVTSDPKLCSTLDARVDPLPRPAYITPALAAAATELDGIEPATVPLVLALEWVEARGEELATDHDAAAALDVALGAIEWNVERVVG